MNIKNNFNRINRFFWNRRRELLSKYFWKSVINVIKIQFDIWNRIPKEEFQKNMRILESRPFNLNIELTNICNSNCIFCAYQYQTRKSIKMQDIVFNKALDEYCQMGGGDLNFNVIVGDPSIDDKLIERIEEARKRKEIRIIRTITNGIIIDVLGIDNLIKSGLSEILISVAAFDKDIYTSIYRNSSYERMKQNVYTLLKRNEELGGILDITIAFRSNLTMDETLNLKDYEPFKKYKHNTTFNTDFDTWVGRIKQSDLLDGMYIRPIPIIGKEPCISIIDSPIIFSDGKIGLCGCRDFNADSELIVGNILTDKLIDVWQNERVKNIRQRFFDGNPPDICKSCTQYVNLDIYRTKKGILRREYLEEISKV